MNSWPHDPELPAGFQDADLEMAELERRAAGDRSTPDVDPPDLPPPDETLLCVECGAEGDYRESFDQVLCPACHDGAREEADYDRQFHADRDEGIR